MQASRSRTPPARVEDLKLGAVQGKKRGPKPRGSVVQLSHKLTGSKEAPRSAPRSSNGRARVEVARNHGNGKLRKKELMEISDEESSDAASGYYVSDSEEEEVQPTPAAYSRKVGEAAAARSLGIKTSSLKKQAAVKKAARPKASGKEADTSDGVEDEALDEVDDMSYYVSQNGGGRDGPLNINLPGADSSSWTSSDFCLVVNNGWRRDRGEMLAMKRIRHAADPTNRRVVAGAGDSIEVELLWPQLAGIFRTTCLYGTIHSYFTASSKLRTALEQRNVWHSVWCGVSAVVPASAPGPPPAVPRSGDRSQSSFFVEQCSRPGGRSACLFLTFALLRPGKRVLEPMRH